MIDSFTDSETNEPNKCMCSEVFCFIAKLVEHCTGITEVMSSTPIRVLERPEFFRCLEEIHVVA